MKVQTYPEIARAMRLGYLVLKPNGAPSEPEPERFENPDTAWAITYLPTEYDLVPTDAVVAELERRHHNRVTTLQHRLSRARSGRDRAQRLLATRDTKIAQLRENERELASTLGRVAAERDQLRARLAERDTDAKAADPTPSPFQGSTLVHLCDVEPTDVFTATGLACGRLWRTEKGWLHHPDAEATVDWQSGYQPVPLADPPGHHLVWILDRTKPRPMTKAEAEARGFTVDTTCYPWFAYKGPRFEPTESALTYTPPAGLDA